MNWTGSAGSLVEHMPIMNDMTNRSRRSLRPTRSCQIRRDWSMGLCASINCIIGSAGHVDGEQRRMSAKNVIRRTADGIVPPASGAMSMCARSTRPLELITAVACPLEQLRADEDMTVETLQCVGVSWFG